MDFHKTRANISENNNLSSKGLDNIMLSGIYITNVLNKIPEEFSGYVHKCVQFDSQHGAFAYILKHCFTYVLTSP